MTSKRYRTAASLGRTPLGGRSIGRLTARFAFPAAVLALVAAALTVGAAFAAAMTVVPTTTPFLVAGWATAIGLTFVLPLAVVRGAVAVLERLQ